MPTKNQLMSADLTALLRARNTLLWVQTREELRVERAIVEAAGAAKYEVRFWDVEKGITGADGRAIQDMSDPAAALRWIETQTGRVVLVMRDLQKWFDPQTLRALRNRAKSFQNLPRGDVKSIVILTPSGEVPPELAGHATVLDWPLPERFEISGILEDAVSNQIKAQNAAREKKNLEPEDPEKIRATMLPDRDAAIDAAVGLTAEEAANCFSKSLVSSKPSMIDPVIISNEKKRVIAREKVLTWYDPDPRGLDAIGGLDVMKPWLVQRRLAMSQAAREYGLPAPKGMAIVGPPGTGKSLTAKAVASAWRVPLLRLDMGALRSKYVGESEGNIRKALAVASAVSPCVLWLDEIEKSVAGSSGTQGDGGVAADALGAVLTWMQEQSGVFVVATANDVRALPPELLRKGRFDELWFVDLPTRREREEILATAIRQFGRDPAKFDLEAIARGSDRFTGAELSACVSDALFVSFADGARELTTEDVVRVVKGVVPLADTAAGTINNLRDWAKGKAKCASLPEKAETSGRSLDLGDEDVN